MPSSMKTMTDHHAHDLKPAGGTPLSQWFSCCIPKSEGSSAPPTNKKRHITFDDEPKEITDTREEMLLETEIVEDDVDAVDGIPDMDDPDTAAGSSNKGTATAAAHQNNNWLEQFFAMMFQLLFLQFLRDAQNKRRIKNEAE